MLASMPFSSRSSRVAVCIGDSLLSRLPPKSCHSSLLSMPASQPFALIKENPAPPAKWANGCVNGAGPARVIVAVGPTRGFAVTVDSASAAPSLSRVGCLGLCASSAFSCRRRDVVLAAYMFACCVRGVASSL